MASAWCPSVLIRGVTLSRLFERSVNLAHWILGPVVAQLGIQHKPSVRKYAVRLECDRAACRRQIAKFQGGLVTNIFNFILRCRRFEAILF
jgi:hypothetical protein